MKKRDFSKQPDYTNRQMFLDKAGPVSTQRFEEFAYPKIAKFDEAQRAAFWVPEEINLTKDKIDFKEASKAVKHIFTSNLLRQTTLDSIQGRAPAQIFTPVVSVPELESLMLTWTWFEMLHSRAYSHIIRNIYNVPKDEFNSIHDNKEIVAMTASIGKYYDALHDMNCLIQTSGNTDWAKSIIDGVVDGQTISSIKTLEPSHIKAIYLALIASFGLEAIRFTVSFATSLAMVENKIFIGNGNEIALILADEMLHVDWTAYIINAVVQNDSRFAKAAKECKDEAIQLLLDVVDEEKQWAKYIFKEGSVIGLNEKVMTDFVDWTAKNRFKEIGFKYDSPLRSSPIPWFNKHLNTDKKQTALQENESTSYLIGSMTNDVNHEELPEL